MSFSLLCAATVLLVLTPTVMGILFPVDGVYETCNKTVLKATTVDLADFNGKWYLKTRIGADLNFKALNTTFSSTQNNISLVEAYKDDHDDCFKTGQLTYTANNSYLTVLTEPDDVLKMTGGIGFISSTVMFFWRNTYYGLWNKTLLDYIHIFSRNPEGVISRADIESTLNQYCTPNFTDYHSAPNGVYC